MVLPTAFNCVALIAVPEVIAAGVAQVTAACRWSVMVIGDATLLEIFGLVTCAETDTEAVEADPAAFGATLTVSVTESLALAARPVVRVHAKVAGLHVQPPVESVIEVAVRPVGSVTARARELGSAMVALVLVTFTVIVSELSPSLNTAGLGLVLMLIETVAGTTGVTKLERSNSEYSSIFSCALIPEADGAEHSVGNASPPVFDAFST